MTSGTSQEFSYSDRESCQSMELNLQDTKQEQIKDCGNFMKNNTTEIISHKKQALQ